MYPHDSEWFDMYRSHALVMTDSTFLETTQTTHDQLPQGWSVSQSVSIPQSREDVWSQKWKQSWSTWAICSGAQQRANPQLPVVESLFATFCEDPWRLEHLTLNSVSIINAFLRSCHSHFPENETNILYVWLRGDNSWSCINDRYRK